MSIKCIWGFSNTGKTTLANKLAKETGAIVFHTDSYIDKGFKESIYFLLEDLRIASSLGRPVIVEGVQVPRLLRAGLRADVIIRCVADDGTRKSRGEINEAFDNAQLTVWEDCKMECIEYRT